MSSSLSIFNIFARSKRNFAKIVCPASVQRRLAPRGGTVIYVLKKALPFVAIILYDPYEPYMNGWKTFFRKNRINKAAETAQVPPQ